MAFMKNKLAAEKDAWEGVYDKAFDFVTEIDGGGVDELEKAVAAKL
jgi:hypothetical protein